MAENYLSYFIRESVILTYDPRLMNMTVLYWLAINIANLWILYKEYFCGDVEEAMQAVKVHVYSTFRKLGVNNRGGAVCIVREEHEKEV